MQKAEARAQYLELVEYFEAMKNGSLVTFYTRLAGKLSAVVNRQEPWTWRYVQGVAKGTIAPSQEFIRAVQILGAEVDGMPVEIARLEQVDVYAEPGAVQHGAIVVGYSRVCASPGCNRVFVPNTPLRTHCTICRPGRKQSR